MAADMTADAMGDIPATELRILAVDVVVLQNTDGRSLDIVILATSQRPEEGGKPGSFRAAPYTGR